LDEAFNCAFADLNTPFSWGAAVRLPLHMVAARTFFEKVTKKLLKCYFQVTASKITDISVIFTTYSQGEQGAHHFGVNN
jgi:hypothetical protein